MKIVNIKKVGRKPVYDISVNAAEHYVLENGVITHNTGQMYSSDTIITITKSQEKVSNEIRGYKFTLTIYKSRFVKEKSKIPITVLFDEGIKPYSGLLDIALESGHVIKPKKGKYQAMIGFDDDTGEIIFGKEVSEKLTHKDEFWKYILEESNFSDSVEAKYRIGTTKLIADDEDEE